MRCLWVVLLLSGCFEVPNETRLMPTYAAEVLTAARVWEREYGPVDVCAVEMLTYSVNDVYFNAGPEDTAKGGHLHMKWPDRERHVISIRSAWTHEASTIVTHEMMHILAECSGTFPDDDPDHLDATIWGGGGILARVNEALGLPGD